MAKEEKKEASKGGEKKPKHKLRSIHTHVAEDGSFVHEHHYEDHRGHPMPPRFGGVSEDMNDLQQHMQDHLGSGADDAEDSEPGDGEPEAGAQGQAQPAPAGAPAEPDEEQ